MKKALEKIKEIIDFCDAVGCHRAIYESIKFVEKELEEAQLTRREWYQKGYNEAMKPKTCEWKNLEDDESYGWLSSCGCCYPHQKVWFQFCPMCGYKVIKNEPKDNA